MNDTPVITGFGLISSLGMSASVTWDAVVSGRSGIRPVTDFDASGFVCGTAAQAPVPTPEILGIHPRDARIMDRHSLMLMKACRDAYVHARLDVSPLPPDEMGFFAGMGMVDYAVDDLLPAVKRSLGPDGNIIYDTFYSGAFREIYPLWPLSMLNNIGFCQVAIALGIKGENTVFSPHADSGMQAIMEGADSIVSGKSQAVLAGGVSEKVSPLSLARASWFGVLSGDTTCRPFSGSRKGTVLGEGCGTIILEPLSLAKERGSVHFASVTGYACTFGKIAGQNCPSGGAVASSMKQALEKAGLATTDIDLIIAHGDGTQDGDRNEAEAVRNMFLNDPPVYSSKGALGHLLAGSPAADVILGVHMLKHGMVPPVCSILPGDEGIGLNLVREPLKADVKRILINATSYEGQCASLIIEAVDE